MSEPEDHNRPASSGAPDPPGGLGRRFLIGTMQLGLGNTAASIVNVIIGVMLARILGPEEFGLFAFAFVISELLGIVSAFSLGTALIQTREESQRLYDTALVMLLGLGLLSLALAAVIAPFLREARGEEAAQFLLILTAGRVLFLLSGVPRAKLERSLRYGLVTSLSMTETTLPNLIALGLAYLGWGAWALLARDVLVCVLAIALETWASGYRFRGEITRPAAQRLMAFAKPMFLARAIDILVLKVDKLAVGAFLGNAAVGLFDRGRFVAETGLFVMRPVERASLNLFSRIQDDAPRLSRSYGIVNYFLVRIMFAGALVLLLTPHETLRVLFGDDWVGAAPALRWLAIHAAIHPIYSMIKVLVIARNRVSRLAKLAAIQASLLIPGTLWAAHLQSLEGVAAVVALATCVGTGLGLLWVRDLAAISYRQLFAVPVAGGAIAAGVLLALDLAGAGAALPEWVRPLLVAAAFAMAVFAMERHRIRAELTYLRNQLGQRPPANATP